MNTLYWFGLHLLLGLWLLISPYALGFTENAHAFWNTIGVGALAVIIALAGMYYHHEHVREPGVSQKASRA